MRFYLLPPNIRRVVRGALSPACRMLILFLLATPALFAQETRPLARRIDFTMKNGTLREALENLRAISGLSVSYNAEEIDKQPRMSLHLTNETVRRILEKLLAPTSLQYIEDERGSILITPRRKKDQVRDALFFIIDGQVVDRKGQPLSNASIQVVGEQFGATTNPDGMFKALVREGIQIKISFLGMRTVERTIRSRSFIKIEMDTAPAVMHEYVITGYQTVDKRMLASSVFTLTPDKFLESGVPSVDQMLQGKVPGLVMINSSGSPSATPKIRIRGTSTILGNASPVWVVDNIIREDPVDLNPLQVNAALQDAQNANFNIVGNAISGLNPYDIESLTFLKDAAATAIYGVKAANGVIVVKTKRGKPGPLTVGYSASLGVTGRPTYRNIDAMNSKDRIDVSREAAQKGTYYGDYPLPASYEGLLQQLYNRSITQDQFNRQVGVLETMNTDWLKLLARNQINQSHSISISGGAGRTMYYCSLGYTNFSGTFQGDDVKSYSVMANITGGISSRLSFDMHIDGSYRNSNGFFQVNPNDYALKTSRTISADSPYVAAWANNAIRMPRLPLHYSIFNELAQTGNTSTDQALNASVVLTYNILPGLSWAGTFGGAMSNSRSFSYAAERSYYISLQRGYDYGAVSNGSLYQQWSTYPFGGMSYPSSTSASSYTVRNQLDFNHNFFKGRDQLSVSFIQELRSTTSDGLKSQELGYYPDRGNTYSTFYSASTNANPLLRHIVQSTNIVNNTLSWAGVLSYRFKKRYILNADIRTDGNNRFGQYANQKFLPNWSIAGRWDLGEEPWFAKSDIISGCDIRASYGTQGNVVTAVGPNLIANYPTSPVDPASNEYVLNLQSLPYPELRWEKTHQWNTGITLNLFNARVTVGADAFFKRSKDLLITKNVPVEYGIPQMYMNYGVMDNAGWDANMTLVPVRLKDFTWAQSFIYSQVSNNIARSDVKYVYGDYLAGNAIVPGKPLGALYSYAFTGLSHQYGIPQYDMGGQGAKGDNPATFLAYSGRKDPLITLGTTTSLTYRRLSMTANFYVSLGNVRRLNPIYNGMAGSVAGLPPSDKNLPKELVDRWRQPGDETRTNIPAFTNWQRQSGYVLVPTWTNYADLASPYSMYDMSSARTVSGSYLRCKSISVNYIAPVAVLKRMGVKNATISATVNNPFVIKSKGMRWQDPETANIGLGAMPITASYYLSMNVHF